MKCWDQNLLMMMGYAEHWCCNYTKISLNTTWGTSTTKWYLVVNHNPFQRDYGKPIQLNLYESEIHTITNNSSKQTPKPRAILFCPSKHANPTIFVVAADSLLNHQPTQFPSWPIMHNSSGKCHFAHRSFPVVLSSNETSVHQKVIRVRSWLQEVNLSRVTGVNN